MFNIDFIKQYITIAEFKIDYVFGCLFDPQNTLTKIKFKVNGFNYSVDKESIRYKVFFKSKNCRYCGIQGTHFLLQQKKGKDLLTSPNSAHFNLYAKDFLHKNNGNSILMTKDHFIPKSKGGNDSLDNLKTACAICNTLKGSNIY